MITKAARFSARVLQHYEAAHLPAGITVRAATETAPAEILCYDEIGSYGVSAKAFTTAMASAGAGPIRVRINSPGGNVMDGMAIFNALRVHPGGVTTVIDGLAASAASFIALAGTTCDMGEMSMFMIHNSSTIAWGNKADLAAVAETLAKIDTQMVDVYAQKTGLSPEDVAALMDAETWYTPTEALAAGFANSIVTPPAKAPIDPAPDTNARTRRILSLRARIALAA